MIALLLAWGAAWLAQKQPTQKHTYGYRRASILAALFNAGLLLVAVGGIVVEAINRLREPAAVASWTVVVVAAFGILINGGTALLFMRGRHGDLNIRGAYLHMVADAGVSLGVVVAALRDHVHGMAVGRSRDQPRDRRRGVLERLGAGARQRQSRARRRAARYRLSKVRDYLGGLEGVSEVHDLHVWAMSTNETALTAHLVRPGGTDDEFLHQVCEQLSHRFNIHHATLQIEFSGDVCKLAPAERV